MKRPRTLNATFVRKVTRPGRYGDGRGGHGLSLLVRQRQSNHRLAKTWNQRIRIDGRERDLGLGSYPAVKLAEARRRALANRQAVEEGRNPRGPKVPTFEKAAAAVIELHSAKWKPGSKTRRLWETTLETYAFPKIADKRVDRITSAEVLACLAPIWATKPETARKVRRRIAAVMKWAVAQGYRQDNPADDRITAALGSNRKPPKHARALHHSKMPEAMWKIEETSAWWATKAGLRFLALTATRSGEVRAARWCEIDLPESVWTVPASRTKTGKALRIPLSTAAMEVLVDSAGQTNGRGLIFPSPRGKVLSSEGFSKLLRENKIGCVPHGFRSSFRDWCGETGVPREVAEAALGHVVNGVEGAYARSDLLERRRPVMEEWGSYTVQ